LLKKIGALNHWRANLPNKEAFKLLTIKYLLKNLGASLFFKKNLLKNLRPLEIESQFSHNLLKRPKFSLFGKD